MNFLTNPSYPTFDTPDFSLDNNFISSGIQLNQLAKEQNESIEQQSEVQPLTSDKRLTYIGIGVLLLLAGVAISHTIHSKRMRSDSKNENENDSQK